MKITQEKVREIKKHLSIQWHDEDWWKVHKSVECEAVMYAMTQSNDIKEISDIATDYIEDMKKNETGIFDAASALGKKGGSAKSDAKKKSSAENGKLGGRPKGSGKKKVEDK